MTRSVEDSALMMNEISRPDARDWTSLPHDASDFTRKLGRGIKGLRIAYSPNLGYAEVNSEVADLVDAAVKVLRKLGAKVERVDPGFADPAPCFRVLWWSGVRMLLAKLPEEQRQLLDPGLRDVLEQSQSITLEEHMEAVRQRGLLGTHMRLFMQRYDLLVTPTLPIPAFEAGRLSPIDDAMGKWVNWTPFSYPFNLTQQPAASVPCGFTKAGLPVGLHVVGQMFADKTVLDVAYAYEQENDWREKRPELRFA